MLALQLLFAASSSPLPWCAERFSIVGFSLGGAVSMNFAAAFPQFVRGVALLAPVGLLRGLPGSYEELRRAARGEEMGEEELRGLLRGVLGVGGEEAADEVVRNADAVVKWQFEEHEGFARSFVSTLVYGPLQGQEEVWRRACGELEERRRERGGRERMVVVCGDEDWVVPAEHVREDLKGMMGDDGFVFKTVKGGHGFPLDEIACEQVVEALVAEWEL